MATLKRKKKLLLTPNNLFRGDLIVIQSNVICFKKKKNKKKQPTPKRCLLIVTKHYIAFMDSTKPNNEEFLGFPITTIAHFKCNDSTSNAHKLEISVFIKNKTHQICIEFTTNDAEQKRQALIKHFTTNNIKRSLYNNSISSPSNPEPPNNTHNTQILHPELVRKRGQKLIEHKYLATLYKTLVGQDVLTPDEFWNEYGKDIENEEASNKGLVQGMSNTALHSTVQRETWSLFSVFKDDIHNVQNGEQKNKLTINLTPQKILEIFIHLPQVKLAYEQNVPFRFSEEEFWKAFLQSHYFKRATARNETPGKTDKATKDTHNISEIDTLLNKYMAQIQSEEHIDDMDIDDALKDKDGRIEANKPLKRTRFKKKVRALDPSVDLTATMESFTEVIEDPGNDEHKDNVQSWFNQVNKHGTMLLYQSLNQRNKKTNNEQKEDIQDRMTNVPKVNYGRKQNEIIESTDKGDDMDGDIKMNDKDDTKTDNNLNTMEMDYEDRLNIETEFEDLIQDDSHKYIELNIKDQSVYWKDDIMLNDKDLKKMNDTSVSLYNYMKGVEDKKKKLREQKLQQVIGLKFVERTIHINTENNVAFCGAQLASEQIIENRKRNNNKQETLLIFTQNKQVVANKKILEQLVIFQKQMKELVRHYWLCFPADNRRLQKAEIIVKNIKEYKAQLIQFQMALDKKSNTDYKIQKILLQELIDLAEKLLHHHNNA